MSVCTFKQFVDAAHRLFDYDPDRAFRAVSAVRLASCIFSYMKVEWTPDVALECLDDFASMKKSVDRLFKKESDAERLAVLGDVVAISMGAATWYGCDPMCMNTREDVHAAMIYSGDPLLPG